MLEKLLLAWALLATAVHGLRMQSNSIGEGEQFALDGKTSAPQGNNWRALTALLLAFSPSPSYAFTLGPGMPRHVNYSHGRGIEVEVAKSLASSRLVSRGAAPEMIQRGSRVRVLEPESFWSQELGTVATIPNWDNRYPVVVRFDKENSVGVATNAAAPAAWAFAPDEVLEIEAGKKKAAPAARQGTAKTYITKRRKQRPQPKTNIIMMVPEDSTDVDSFGFKRRNTLSVYGEVDALSGSSSNKQKTENEYVDYNLNLAEAMDSLNRDIPQALRLEDDPQRLVPTNWDIYTDSLETDLRAIDIDGLDTSAFTSVYSMLAGMPSWSSMFQGLSATQFLLLDLRTVVETLRSSKVLESDQVKVSTHIGVDPSTGEDVIEARWIAKLVMKRLQIPQGVSTPADWPKALFASLFGQSPERDILQVEALSRFHLNADGKIYRHSIDELDLRVDEQVVQLKSANEQDVLLKSAGEGQPLMKSAAVNAEDDQMSGPSDS